MTTRAHAPSAILLVACPDRPGILSAITGFVSQHGGNILELQEHVETVNDIFLMRIEWEMEPFDCPREEIAPQFQSIADRFSMNWSLHFSDATPRMAVLVTKQSHCLHDLLARYESGQWNVDIPVIISNHDELRPIAERFGIDYYHVPISKQNKREQEEKQLDILDEYGVDIVVLARYMQILTDAFISRYRNRIINIHHSFLPAFPGARPYHSAYERGVKIIGATSHYATEDLDEGPIIAQDTVHVSHEDDVRDLMRKGQDLEKVVLARAVWNHLERRTLVHDNRTAVFD